MIWSVFLVGGAVYAAFVAWYFNWKGPLTPAEIDAIMQAFDGHPASANTKPDVLRAFMEADDGQEFCMANNVKLRDGMVIDPQSGREDTSERVVQAYMKKLMKPLLRRGCHPVYQARRVGGFIDSWGSDDRMEFPLIAMVRYRSRRDLAQLISGQTAPETLKIKENAIEYTISVPTQITVSLCMRPKYSVPMIILLVCCIVQIIFGTL